MEWYVNTFVPLCPPCVDRVSIRHESSRDPGRLSATYVYTVTCGLGPFAVYIILLDFGHYGLFGRGADPFWHVAWGSDSGSQASNTRITRHVHVFPPNFHISLNDPRSASSLHTSGAVPSHNLHTRIARDLKEGPRADPT